jgi:alpha-L-fucosidase
MNLLGVSLRAILVAVVWVSACNHVHMLGGIEDGAASDGAPPHPDAGSDGSALQIERCPTLPGAPAGLAPLPTPSQVALQRMELMGYMHFGLETFDPTDTGDPARDVPALFNPTSFDPGQWMTEFKNVGAGQVVLVVKSSLGFCLWPSAYTDYSVKNSTWKNGKGDVVKEFTDAARAAGLRAAFYISTRDVHYPASSPTYDKYFQDQLTELLTNYGPIHEVEFPGDNPPTGMNWAGIVELAHRLQPGIVVWTGPEIATTGVDARFLNLTGAAPRSTSSIATIPNGGPSNVWYPAESIIASTGANIWFWHPTNPIMPLGQLQSAYLTTVGRNAILAVNVAPAASGQLDSASVDLLRQFGRWRNSLYQTNLVQGLPVSADSTWANTGFSPAKAVDGDICTYWAAASGKTTARLEVTPVSPLTFKVISIQEPIEWGERTTAYHVEFKQNGIWNVSPKDASGVAIAGTVIGQRQIWQLNSTTADAIALVIDSAKDVPAIAEFGVF